MPDSLSIDLVVNTDAAQSALEQTATGLNDVADAADRGDEAISGFENSVGDTNQATGDATNSANGFGFAIGGLGSKLLLAAGAFVAANIGIGLFSNAASKTFEVFDTRIGVIDRARTSFILTGDSLQFAEDRATRLVNTLRFDTLGALQSVSAETSYLFNQVLTKPERTAVEELALQLERAGVSSRELALDFATQLQGSVPNEPLFNQIALEAGITSDRLRDLSSDGIGPLIEYLIRANAAQSSYAQALFLVDDAHDDLNKKLGELSQGTFETFLRGWGFIIDNLVTTEKETEEVGDQLKETFGIDVDQTSPLGKSLLGYRMLIDGVSTAAETALTWVQRLLGLEPDIETVSDPIASAFAIDEFSRSGGEGQFPRVTTPLSPDEIYDPRFRPDLPTSIGRPTPAGIPTPVVIELDGRAVGEFVVNTIDGQLRQVPVIL